jgi:anthranilate/para-aminobenzoate synthase component II
MTKCQCNSHTPQYKKSLKKHPVASGKKLMDAMPKQHRPEVWARYNRMLRMIEDRKPNMGICTGYQLSSKAHAAQQRSLTAAVQCYANLNSIYAQGQFNCFPLY